MIVIENVTINGVAFVKTYSDIGMKIERDGVRYDEAIDPLGFNRQYTETDEPISTDPEIPEDEATAEDYEAALREMGVEV